MPCVNVEEPCPCFTQAQLELVADGGITSCRVRVNGENSLVGTDATTGLWDRVVVEFEGDPDERLFFCEYRERTPNVSVSLEIPEASYFTCGAAIEAECLARGP